MRAGSRGSIALLLLCLFLSAPCSVVQASSFEAPKAVDPDAASAGPPAEIRELIRGLPESGAAFPSVNATLDEPSDAETRGRISEAQSPPEQGPSALERLYRENYGTPAARELRQFGYELFSERSTLLPRSAVPPPGYVLGPGDRIKVRAWGSGMDFAFTGEVAADGGIDLPRIGIVPLAGKTLREAKKLIASQLSSYAGGLNLELVPVKLRDLEVYVVGEVENPGLTLVPAYGTVISALEAAGGVKKSGSLRAIRLFRAGGGKHCVDLYELLLAGSRSSDLALADRDVVFVPRIGSTAAAAGAVAGPAIYELAGERHALELLELAGGPLPQGFTGRFHLRRFADGERFVILDVESRAGLEELSLRDGDLLELDFINAERPPVVRLTGHVMRPEVFDWRQGLKLSDVLSGPGQLRPGAITGFAHIHRYDPESTRTSVMAVPLDRALDGRFDAPLKPFDTIRVLSREGFGISEPVRLAGAVWKEGEFEHSPGLKLIDLLALGGGLKFGANHSRIEISRKEIIDGAMATRHYFVDFDAEPEHPIRPHDYIFVPRAREASEFNTARVSGEVRYPGVYRIRRGETLSDLIERAGGFTEEAYFYGARFTSEKARRIQQESIDQLIRELEVRTQHLLSDQLQTAVDNEDADAARASRAGVQALISKLKQVRAEGRVSIELARLEVFRGSRFDFPVDDKDALHVPKKPNFVSVVGSVYSPSAYLYQPALEVEDYLEKSGGATKTADQDHMYVLRADGEVFSRAQSSVSSSSFLDAELMPGDTIVVPEDLERVPYMRLFKDLTDIVFKIATTAGVVYAIL